jgi:hypothetical protein
VKPFVVPRPVIWAFGAAPILVGAAFFALGLQDAAVYAGMVAAALLASAVIYTTLPAFAIWATLLMGTSFVAVALRLAQGGSGPPTGMALVAVVGAWLVFSACALMPGLPVTLRANRARRESGFGDLLVHEVSVQPGPGGRPGERVLSYSRSVYDPQRPRPEHDGHLRHDFRVLVGHLTTLSVECMGPTSKLGDAQEATRRGVERSAEKWDQHPTEVLPQTVAGEQAYRLRYSRKAGAGNYWTWRLAHNGWLYEIALIRSARDDEDEMLRRAYQVLGSWRWVDA